MVGHQHHAAGIFDNRAFGAHFVIVEFEQRAVHIDAADAENAVIETELRDEVQGGFAHDAAVAGAHFTAGQDQAEVFLGGQQGGDVEVVGDYAQVLVVHQRMGHRFRRGADIDEQRGAVRDLAGDALRDAGFLF